MPRLAGGVETPLRSRRNPAVSAPGIVLFRRLSRSHQQILPAARLIARGVRFCEPKTVGQPYMRMQSVSDVRRRTGNIALAARLLRGRP